MSEYFFVIDYVEAFFWTVAYAFIALVGIVNKDDQRLAMPAFSLFANFAWEVASVLEMQPPYFDQGGSLRIAWFVFDIFILIAVYRKNKELPNFKNKVLQWGIPWIVLAFVFYTGFQTHDLFMPISSFVIDIEMAILFWCRRKKLDPSLRLYIGITKLLGDVLAGVFCGNIHYSIIVMAFGSFVFNVLYIIYAVKEIKENPDVNDTFKNNARLLIEKIKNRHVKQIKHSNKKKLKKNKKRVKTHRKKS